MLRPLQQHSHFADCLRAAGREVVETPDGYMLQRRFAGLKLGLVSRGSEAMMRAPAPRGCAVIFNAETQMAQAARSRGYFALHRAAEVAEWDISKPEPALRAGLRKTWRHGLAKAEASGLKLAVTQMPATPDHWVLMAEQAQARARRYRALPLWITRAWATLHPKDAVLIEARLRGDLVAGMVFLRHGNVATYHVSHTTEAGKAAEAHRLMLWRAAAHFAQRGVVRMDLGLVDHAQAAGLARFKLGTGAVGRELGGTYLLLPGLSALKRGVSGGHAKPRPKLDRGSV